jgi:hypothetical protein
MREDRGWSQQRAFEELRFGLQFGPKSRASYRALDIGTRIPTIAEQEFIVGFFGKSPDDLPDLIEPTEPADALVAALTAQTEAINALVERLDSFVGPLGEVVADMLRDRVKAATARTRSGAPNG